MITDVYMTYTDESVKRRIEEFNSSVLFHLIDSLSKDGKKKSRALKGHWAAHLDPFALAMDGEKPIRVFYSETGEDVVESVKKYINEH